jgi:hypothetical protein
MKLVGINVRLSGRKSQTTYTALTQPSGTVENVINVDDVTFNVLMEDELGANDTASPYSLDPQTALQLTSVTSTATSVEVQARRVASGVTIAGPRHLYQSRADSMMVDAGGGTWDRNTTVDDIIAEFWDTPAHGSSPWSDIEVRFKIITPEGVTFTSWYDLIVTDV